MSEIQYATSVTEILKSVPLFDINDPSLWSPVMDYVYNNEEGPLHDDSCHSCANYHYLEKLAELVSDQMGGNFPIVKIKFCIRMYFVNRCFKHNEEVLMSVFKGDLGDYYDTEFNGFMTRILHFFMPKKFDYYSPEFRKLRLDVFLRDGEKCGKCGAIPKAGTSLTIDHIKPVSKFPELAMDIDNLQVLCWECNQGKSNKHYTDYR